MTVDPPVGDEHRARQPDGPGAMYIDAVIRARIPSGELSARSKWCTGMLFAFVMPVAKRVQNHG